MEMDAIETHGPRVVKVIGMRQRGRAITFFRAIYEGREVTIWVDQLSTDGLIAALATGEQPVVRVEDWQIPRG
jgi:hypothetical protein